MSRFLRFEAPQTRPEIVAALNAVHAQASDLWRKFSDAEFFALPANGGWSPSQNVEHLVKSTSPVTMALGFPRFVLRLLFGRARVPSRSFVEVRAAYRAVLADGPDPGRFGPSKRRAEGQTLTREQQLDKWQGAVPRLTAAIERWDEASLDYYRIPHPLLGKLTVREMLFFTLYHLSHHVEIVASRHGGAAGASLDAGAAH